MQFSPLHAYELINSELLREEHNEWSGFLQLNETNAKALQALVKAELCEEYAEVWDNDKHLKDYDLSDISIPLESSIDGKKIRLALEETSNKHQHPIQKNWDEFLLISDVISSPVSGIYFTESKTFVDATSNTPAFDAYLATSKIHTLLSEISDTQISNTKHVYIFGHALTLEFSVCEASLSQGIDTTVLEELLNKDIHKEAKTSLVKEALVRFLKNISEKERFNFLISHFNGFSTELLVSYEQFLKNYTFDKVRKEYQEKKTDYIARINKVFDDIATKTLAVPAGLWFAMNQISTATPGNLQEAKNLATLLISALLVCLVLFNIWGQFSVLKAIKKEYNNLFQRISSEYLDKVSLEDAQEHTKCEFEKDLVDIDNAKKELDDAEHTVYVKLSLTCCLIISIGLSVGMLTYFGVNN